MKALQEREDQGEHELYYFDESGFSQAGFLSRAGKRVYHTTTETVTTETVIEAFDQFVIQKDPDTFAVVVLDNASMHRSKVFRQKVAEWMSHRVRLILLIGLLARAESD